MTPRSKSNWRLFLMGFVLPGFLVWLVYYAFVSCFFLQIFRFTGSRAEFTREFFDSHLSATYPPIDLVVLGDSTAKSALNPLSMNYLFGINLALNGGTALSSYHLLERYLRDHPKPKCVLYVSQYNWNRNYAYFFDRIVNQRSLGFRELFAIWRFGYQHGIYPRTELTTLSFFLSSLRYYFYVGELPLNLIQKAIGRNLIARQAKWEANSRQMIINRGFQNNELRRVQPEHKFMNPELHAAYLAPFSANITEDFYIGALIERTEKLGIKLLWAMLPLADSDHYVAAEVHQRERDIHVLRMMQNRPHVIQVPMPTKFPRKYYFDFTHMVPEGAVALQPYFDPSLREHCASGG